MNLLKIIQRKALNIVNKILEAKKSDPSTLESQIDQLVYKLCDLPEEKIKIVEGL